MKKYMLMFLAFFMMACDKKSEGYIQVDQGQLYYRSFGKGDPIIILHGGPGGLDHNYLLPQMQELAKKHRVIFYDQRGSGKSSKAFQPNLITVGQFVKDLEALRHQLGLKKFNLLGHSWGGLLAMHYAMNHPENLNHLILCNSAPATSKLFFEFIQNWMKQVAPIQSKLKTMEPNSDNYGRLLFSVYCYNREDSQKISMQHNVENPEVGDQVMQIFSSTYLMQFYDIQKELGEIRCPTLIIHGDVDIVPVEGAKNLHVCIPQSELKIIKNCGHFPYVEKPEEFFGIVDRFLRGDPSFNY